MSVSQKVGRNPLGVRCNIEGGEYDHGNRYTYTIAIDIDLNYSVWSRRNIVCSLGGFPKNNRGTDLNENNIISYVYYMQPYV